MDRCGGGPTLLPHLRSEPRAARILIVASLVAVAGASMTVSSSTTVPSDRLARHYDDNIVVGAAPAT